jgi:hypothetical protein
MMELRKKEKEDRQESIPSAKNPTKDVTFRKLTNVCRMVRRKRNPAHVITEYFVTIPGELGLIKVENFYKDL